VSDLTDTALRPLGPRIVAVLFLLLAVNALSQGIRLLLGWDTGPLLLELQQYACGLAALAAATGAWMGRRWSAVGAALYGVLTGILIASLAPLMGLPPEARPGLWLASALVLTVSLVLAWYLRRALARPA
jgi:hypothetical protein